MRSLGSWFSGVIDSVRLMVGLYDLEGLLQHKQFYDSKLICPGKKTEEKRKKGHLLSILF